jgi:hypothetical protein
MKCKIVKNAKSKLNLVQYKTEFLKCSMKFCFFKILLETNISAKLLVILYSS